VSNGNGQGDDLTRLLRIQQRAIRRGARWWFDAIQRFQSGDLDPTNWTEANARYVEEALEDGREAANLFPLDRRSSVPGDKNNGRK